MINVIHLPFNIKIEYYLDAGSIKSNLALRFCRDGRAPGPVATAYAFAIESFLMAMFAEGIDMSDPRLHNALEFAVEGIAGNMGDEVAQKAVVIIDGGLVRDVIADGQLSVIICDKDIEGSDSYVEFDDENGIKEKADLSAFDANVIPAYVDIVSKACKP